MMTQFFCCTTGMKITTEDPTESDEIEMLQLLSPETKGSSGVPRIFLIFFPFFQCSRFHIKF